MVVFEAEDAIEQTPHAVTALDINTEGLEERCDLHRERPVVVALPLERVDESGRGSCWYRRWLPDAGAPCAEGRQRCVEQRPPIGSRDRLRDADLIIGFAAHAAQILQALAPEQ